MDIARHLIAEPEEAYHARRSDHVTSHSLSDFRRSPREYRDAQLGLVEPCSSPAFAVGRAAHCLILEGREEYERRFVVGGPLNPKTGNTYGDSTKAYGAWAEKQDKEAISPDSARLCERMADAVADDPEARRLLRSGVPERVVRIDYCGLPCQARLDWFSDEAGIVDLKTIRQMDMFDGHAIRYGYIHQMAFYRDLLRRFCGAVVDVCVIVVEKTIPHRVAVRRFGLALDAASRENTRALNALAYCRRCDVWPAQFSRACELAGPRNG